MGSTAVEKKEKKEHHFEFGGPYFAPIMIVFLIGVIYFLYYGCNSKGCLSLNKEDPFFLWVENPFEQGFVSWFLSIWSLEIFSHYVLWFAFQALLYIIVPGPIQMGTEIGHKTNFKLPYKLNGYRCMWITYATVFGLVSSGVIKGTYIYDNYLSFATAAIVFSILLSIYLYVSSLLIKAPFTGRNALAEGGNTGYKIYDFFIGRTLNPRIGDFDLKYFCELRPGLILWVLVDLSMAYTQFERTGSVTLSMILVCIFHFFYVWDALNSEAAILTTMDITTDGFGFMLAFGDLAWVPFTYSMQARYLLEYPVELSIYTLIAIFVVKGLGFWIFRGANGQKNDFRSGSTDPSIKNLKYLQTETGSKLLIDGWWGKARHINYFGDWLMGCSWCIPCGFSHILPYFYAFYFAGLLVHREMRDEEKCVKKYKQDWKRYCDIVKYKIVPYLY